MIREYFSKVGNFICYLHKNWKNIQIKCFHSFAGPTDFNRTTRAIKILLLKKKKILLLKTVFLKQMRWPSILHFILKVYMNFRKLSTFGLQSQKGKKKEITQCFYIIILFNFLFWRFFKWKHSETQTIFKTQVGSCFALSANKLKIQVSLGKETKPPNPTVKANWVNGWGISLIIFAMLV